VDHWFSVLVCAFVLTSLFGGVVCVVLCVCCVVCVADQLLKDVSEEIRQVQDKLAAFERDEADEGDEEKWASAIQRLDKRLEQLVAEKSQLLGIMLADKNLAVADKNLEVENKRGAYVL
jgi:septal ring factor EnvC (AmiA/AmiB activator)